MSLRHARPKYPLRHVPVLFCSSVVNSEPTWLRPMVLMFGAVKHLCCTNTERTSQTLWSRQNQMLAHSGFVSGYLVFLMIGTNCDQCVSMVQCCFTSTETWRLIRTGSPGRPPRLSHSSWTLCFCLGCLWRCSHTGSFRCIVEGDSSNLVRSDPSVLTVLAATRYSRLNRTGCHTIQPS